MWRIIEYIAIAAVVLIFITEFFYPLLTQKPLFGSFRSKTGNEGKTESKSGLEDKISDAKEKVKEVKTVQDEVSENFKSAKDLKKDADNLFK